MAHGAEESGKKMASPDKKQDDEEKGKKIIYTIPQPIALPRPAQNYAVLNLDGSAGEVRRSWTRAILQFRLWCYNNTDERFQFGMPSRSSCVLPRSGHFLVYMHYRSDWLCAIIDGASGYLDGYVTRSTGKQKDIRAKENMIKTSDTKSLKQSKPQKEPIYITNSALLPWCGNYVHAKTCRLGHLSMISSFKLMRRNVDGQDLPPKDIVIMAGETFILHLSEAARSDELFYYIYNNFEGQEKLGPERLHSARRWKKECLAARSAMSALIPNRFGAKQGNKVKYVETSSIEGGKATVRTEEAHSIIRNFRLFHRPGHTHGMFKLDKMPEHLAADGPVNKQWAEKHLRESPNCDPAVRFLIERMPKFLSTNNKVKGGGDGSIHASDSMSARPAAHPISSMLEQKFLAAKKGHIATPVGLRNLGNTCYVNSTIQCFRAVPELKSMLMRYSDNKGHQVDQRAHDLTVETRNLLRNLDQSEKTVEPVLFLQMLREKCHQFQQQQENSYMQQDAEEFWTQLLSTFSETFLSKKNEPASVKIKELFGIDFVKRLHCPETGEESLETQSHYFWKCYISNDDVKHLNEVLKLVQINSNAHSCASSSRVIGTMASQAWIAERAVPLLKRKPTMGASEVREELQEKYKISIPYQTVWYGRQRAADKLFGKWDDSFDWLYRFKAEVELRSPGSVVEIDTVTILGEVHFSRFFCAFKGSIDGFLKVADPI